MSSQTSKDVYAAEGCKVTFGGVDLGFTSDGGSISHEVSAVDLVHDARGEHPIDALTRGVRAEVTLNFVKWDQAVWAKLLPLSQQTVGAGGDSKIEVFADVGSSLYDLSEALVIHPNALADTDETFDVRLAKAFPLPFELPYGNDQAVFSVTFRVFPDQSTGLLMTIGDPSVVAA